VAQDFNRFQRTESGMKLKWVAISTLPSVRHARIFVKSISWVCFSGLLGWVYSRWSPLTNENTTIYNQPTMGSQLHNRQNAGISYSWAKVVVSSSRHSRHRSSQVSVFSEIETLKVRILFVPSFHHPRLHIHTQHAGHDTFKLFESVF